MKYDIGIVGGGIAGLTAAIHLSKAGFSVFLIEKSEYPGHKVCGEYISNETLPYLKWLGIDPFDHGAKKIDTFELSTVKNKSITTELPLGGFGLSRYTFDHLLYKKAIGQNAAVFLDTATDVSFSNELFTITTKSEQRFVAKVLIGGFGKRSEMDKVLNRAFIQKKSPYLAVKTHLKGNFKENVVALHNFYGGYCGFSKVENDTINACYITHYDWFKKHKDLDGFKKNIMYRNRQIERIFEESTAVFDQPLTISQVAFFDKKPVADHILMCGDAAGLIHPLCGNGMSMAMHSAKIASEQISLFLRGEIDRSQMEKNYQMQWYRNFKSRLRFGKFLARAFSSYRLQQFIVSGIQHTPRLLKTIIKKTHGKRITAT